MKGIILAAVSAAALVAGPASAQIVDITVIGTVSFGLDSLGLFGPAGRNLTGSAYRMDFAYDLANTLDGGTSRQVNGGTSVNRPSPIVRGDLTIGDTTVSAIDPFRAFYGRFLYPTSSQLDFNTGGPNGVNGANFSWSRQDQSIPIALDSPLRRTFDASDTVFSAFQRANPQLTVFTYLALRPQTLSIALADAAVPEPANWAMMIAGFGLAGAAARRRRPALAA